jgi:hypothetical protein
MSSNASISYITIFPNGPLLSRRYITDLDNNPLQPANVASITLNVYRQSLNAAGQVVRTVVTGWADVALTVAEVVFTAINDANGKPYNFQYCVEGAFTETNATYIVEYLVTLTDGHTIPVVIQAGTTA